MMTRRYAVLETSFLLSIASFLNAQTASMATWPLTNPSTGGTGQGAIISGQIVGYDQLLKNMEINQYTGTNSSQRARMSGTNNTWPANQTTQIDTVYMQFKVSAKNSYTAMIDSVVLRIGAGSLNNMKANIYYSKDSTFAVKTQVSYTTSSTTSPAGTYLSSSALDAVRMVPRLSLTQGESFYVRIYPWVDSQGSAASGKYLCVQNAVIYATAVPLPVAAGVTWQLLNDEYPVVSGLVNAGTVSYAGGLYKYGFNANGVRWTTNNGPQGGGSWAKELSPNLSRYAQFMVSPKIGGTFYSDTLYFTQIAEFTNNLRVALYSSKDTSFAQKKFIADTTVPATITSCACALRDTVGTGEALYVRFYPYDVTGDPSWKLVDMSSVSIIGSTTGLAILPPTVTTTPPSYISTTFATSGGNISSDGGGTITARGVCWNTSGSPTTADSHTSDSTGVGKFVSSMTSLKAGTKYYVRAYAMNAGGTAYGNADSLSTLIAIIPPTVATTAVSNVLVKTAAGGGNVTDWGGDSVKAKGICWNTSGSPTVLDAKTVDGGGLGSYNSGLTGLVANTKYYVRAYATNAAGVGYGSEATFITQVQQKDTTVVVSLDGSGMYRTVQAAFRAVPINYTGKWTIFVKKGSYHEKDTLAAGQVNVVLLGEDRDSTVIWNDDYGDKFGSGNPGTSGTFTVTIDADDFIAKNITIQNTYAPQTGVSGTQAVALSANGDRQEYYNVALRGFQDTYYTRGSRATGRTYHKNCYIEGTVDFIFGRNVAVFDSCTIRELRNGGTLTAASTESTSNFGYVFRNCLILADSVGYDAAPITSFYLGRPWQASPRTVFLNSREPKNLGSAGWLAWNVSPALYAEYHCVGEGASTAGRVTWSSQLTDKTAGVYTLANIFAKSSTSSSLISDDWIPSDTLKTKLVTSVGSSSGYGVPTGFSLSQNYPNPFNPTTTIEFTVPESGHVLLRVFDVLGREVGTLFDEDLKSGGRKRVTFDASGFASGVYFYRLQDSHLQLTEKMVLMK